VGYHWKEKGDTVDIEKVNNPFFRQSRRRTRSSHPQLDRCPHVSRRTRYRDCRRLQFIGQRKVDCWCCYCVLFQNKIAIWYPMDDLHSLDLRPLP